MKGRFKAIKIVLICLLAVAAALAIGVTTLSRVAQKKIRTALADIPGARIDFKAVYLLPVSGFAELQDVDFIISDTLGAAPDAPSAPTPDIQGHIEAIKLEGISWKKLLKGEASANHLVVESPTARIVLKEAKAQSKTKAHPQPKDTIPQKSFLKKVSIGEFRVKDGEVSLKGRKGPMKAAAGKIDISVKDVAVKLPEGAFEYCDSTYSISIHNLDYTDKKGLSRVQIGLLETEEAGPVKAQGLHIYNCVKMEELAEKMGKVAAIWYDAKLDSMSTSPINIPRMINSGSVDIESVQLSGREVTILQDDRYPPAVPYPTIQESLNAVKVPIRIGKAGARIKSLSFIWETTHVNRGTIPLKNVRASMGSVSNARGNLMSINVQTGLADSGSLDLTAQIRNDKAETTSGKFQLLNLDLSRLDGFLRPLFGATARADVHQIEGSFKGDKTSLNANYCMLYDHLSVKAWNDSSAPILVVAKNSGFVTFLANMALPKSNPAATGKEPKKVEFSFKRDPMQPYPAYMVQNLLYGIMHTLLPGSTIRKNSK